MAKKKVTLAVTSAPLLDSLRAEIVQLRAEVEWSAFDLDTTVDVLASLLADPESEILREEAAAVLKSLQAVQRERQLRRRQRRQEAASAAQEAR